MASPFRFDEETCTGTSSADDHSPRTHKRTKLEAEELPLFDETLLTTSSDATAANLLLASDLLLLPSLSPSPSIGDGLSYNGGDDLESGDNHAIPIHDETDDAFLNETFLSLLEPIQSVACKSIHKTNDEAESKSDKGNDTPPNADLEKSTLWSATPTTNQSAAVDVLSTLTEDLVLRVSSYLDALDLVHRFGILNRHYHQLSQLDQAGWDGLCQQLLETKCHVTLRSAAAMQGSHHVAARSDISQRTAYRLAIADSVRQHISLDELCYNPETKLGTLWSFRFKESAGADWTAQDPWYARQQCRKFVFLPDFTMKQVVVPTQPSHSNFIITDPRRYETLPATTQTGVENNVGVSSVPSEQQEVELIDPPTRMHWRFLTRPMDLPTRPMGSYVRIQVSGRDVPTYAVRRSPTGNWGFVLESCWGIYGSFELPPRRMTQTSIAPSETTHAATAADPRAEVSGLQARQRSTVSNRAVDAVVYMQDDCMPLTNEVQWREAFLYNVGARILPEGDAAVDEFDRFWQGAT